MKNILTTTVQQQDDNGEVMVRRVSTIADSDPDVGEFRSGLLADVSEATIGLPITQPLQVHLVNTHATALITVKWTPYGGAQATVIILGPGDGIAFWHKVTGTTRGISSLKLTSDTANATYELFIGG